MKKIFFFISLLAAGYVSAQSLPGKDTIDLICRKWKFSMIEESVLNEMDSTAREDFKKATIIFMKDRTYSSFIGNEAVEKGEWKYTPANRRLVCTALESKSTTVITISSISRDELKGESFLNTEKDRFSMVLTAIK